MPDQREEPNVDDKVVADVLSRMQHITEPERGEGNHPRTKAGWVRAVLAALKAPDA